MAGAITTQVLHRHRCDFTLLATESLRALTSWRIRALSQQESLSDTVQSGAQSCEGHLESLKKGYSLGVADLQGTNI